MIDKINRWLRELVGYYELERELELATDEIIFLDEELATIKDDLLVVKEKYEDAKQEILLAVKKETLPIIELKNWYEKRRSQMTWRYNGGRLGLTDVKNYLETTNKDAFTALSLELISEYKLRKETPINSVITSIYHYWNKRTSWRYRTDQTLHGRMEWWEEPSETLRTRVGDCETKAMCMYWTIDEALRLLGKAEHDWRLTFTASNVVGEGGHAYLTWLHDDGEYYVIESTYDEKNSKEKTWLRTPMRYNNLYGDPWGFANKHRSWKGTNTALMSFRE